MWKGKTVSVVLPTYNEKDSIRQCIKEFYDTGFVDDIFVVNNNAAAGTSQEVAGTGATEIFEDRQGYGFSNRCGLLAATGNLVVVCEPDATFIPNDLIKFLSYSDDFDVVLGTRTSKLLIWEGANMGWFLRWGNILVAKVAGLMFNCMQPSDMGCTYKLLNRKALDRLNPLFTVGGLHFNAELLCLLFMSRLRFIEIPVNYKNRVGQSAATGRKWVAFYVGFCMIGCVLSYWCQFLLQKVSGGRPPGPHGQPANS